MLDRRELLKIAALLGVSEPLRAARTQPGKNSMNTTAILQRLTDRLDIQELMARYCRHADLLDAEGMAACFTDDCVVAYVPASMAAPAHSKKELLGFLHEYFPNSVSSTHYITNVELVFETDDRVAAHTYMYSWQRFKGYPAAADCHRYGRYELRVVRTPDGWRFSRLTLLSAGEYGGTRIGEQFNRPWPPRFE
jgi:hypothetical protein